MTEQMQSAEQSMPARWRLVLALALILLSLGSAAFIPLVLVLPLANELKATLSGLLVFGIPQAMMLLAVVLVGKAGFAYLKGLVFARFRRFAPPQRVGRTRYSIGLVMFVLPLLLAFVTPYAADLLPGYQSHPRVYGVTGDVLLVAGFFVLGGDFWDKVRALFVHDATVRFAPR